MSKSLISEINYCAQINYPARRHPTVDIKTVPAPYCSCLTKNFVEFAYKSCVSRLAHMCLHKLVRSSYEKGIFVGDITTGTLFYFESNVDRTGINLESDPLLSDLIADSDDEISAVTFGTGFAGITDIETNPDGNLYILTHDRETEGQGSLYRILPTGEGATSTGVPSPTPPDTVAPPVADEGEAETEENAEDEADGNSDDNNDGEDQNENSDEFHNALH